MAAPVWIFVLVALTITAVFFLVWWLDRKRRKLLAAWAQQQGLHEYDARAELGWLRDFQAWGPGYGHRNMDGYRGQIHGLAVSIWQHQSRTKTKDGENIHDHTLCLVRTPFPVQRLVIKREGLHHKIFDALGGEDIDFESDAFSRRFWVKSIDRREAYDVIHAGMMEFLMAAPRAHWEWQGDRLLLHVAGSIRPKRVLPLIKNAEGFVERLPRHLGENRSKASPSGTTRRS